VFRVTATERRDIDIRFPLFASLCERLPLFCVSIVDASRNEFRWNPRRANAFSIDRPNPSRAPSRDETKRSTRNKYPAKRCSCNATSAESSPEISCLPRVSGGVCAWTVRMQQVKKPRKASLCRQISFSARSKRLEAASVKFRARGIRALSACKISR